MNYKDTLNLPKTGFPMKADLVKREPALLERWEKEKLYAAIQQQRKDAPLFILHDGPPYANGDVHIGTALNKILKDIVVKSRTMMGFRSPYLPGWDCHGLPIELKVQKEIEQAKTEVSQTEVRARCRAYAEKCLDTQRRQFMRLGVLGDWFNPYLTMSPEYEAEIVAAFYEMWKKGYVYRSFKPVYWCVSCRTALAAATAEAEYADHQSPSVYVKFRVKDLPQRQLPAGFDTSASVIIWTTTPWTLPSNLAIAVHPNYDYVAAQVGNETWIVAEALLPAVLRLGKAATQSPKILGKIKGRELEGLVTRHPFIERDSPIVLADYVTLDTGTGCVHTAPGHGFEDYATGEKYRLQPKAYSPLDDSGRFLKDGQVPDWLIGKQVFEANPLVVDHLRQIGALIASEDVSHSYPHCWRCKNPVIFRSTEQWFVSLDHEGLRRNTLAEIEKVQWVPDWGKNRINGMVKERPDWVISRQRVWGVPIPVISCAACGHTFEEQADRIVALIRAEGVDVWFRKTANEMLPGVTCPKCGKPTEFRKESDILDVWFESGVSHRAVLKTRPALRFPCEAYLEGSDQHRGWFQSALWTAMATDGVAPFKAVVTHGFLVDLDGKKISKSSTYEKPKNSEAFVSKYGADIVRLWVASENYHNDVPLSEEIFTRISETYRSIRNTLRILLANLADFDPSKDRVDLAAGVKKDLSLALDLWMQDRLQDLVRDVRRAYEAYEFHKVYHAVNTFCAVEASSLYVDITKDRMYCDAPGSLRRRATQTVMHEMASALARLLAPILSFTAEETWSFLPGAKGSVHLQDLPGDSKVEAAREYAEDLARLLEHRQRVAARLEEQRKDGKIGKSVDARVVVQAEKGAAADKDFALLQKYAAFLPEFFIVSQVELERADVKGFEVTVQPPKGKKCARSWRWDETVGSDPEHPDLCARDAAAVRDWKSRSRN
jgi:isoleucyl-tRNA synthetase